MGSLRRSSPLLLFGSQPLVFGARVTRTINLTRTSNSRTIFQKGVNNINSRVIRDSVSNNNTNRSIGQLPTIFGNRLRLFTRRPQHRLRRTITRNLTSISTLRQQRIEPKFRTHRHRRLISRTADTVGAQGRGLRQLTTLLFNTYLRRVLHVSPRRHRQNTRFINNINSRTTFTTRRFLSLHRRTIRHDLRQFGFTKR